MQEEEKKRYFTQLAVQGGVYYTSKDTGYLQEGHRIPLYENFCYVLALACSKQKEQAYEAQEMAQKLLHFQNAEGFFPKYLHEFPCGKDLYLQKKLLWVVEELVCQHAVAMGSKVTERLQKAMHALKNCLKDSPNSLEPVTISSRALSSFLVPPTQDKFLQYCKEYSCYFHPALGCYCGPCVDEYYEKSSVKRSVFEYLMASYYQVYPSWMKENRLLQLQAVLIPYFATPASTSYGVLQGAYQKMPWKVVNTRLDSLFFFSSFSPQEPRPGLHVFRYLWEDDEKLYHIVCQSTRLASESRYEEECADVVFTYPEDVSLEGSSQYELELFVSDVPGLTFSVDDGKATTFSLDNTVTLHTKTKRVTLHFSIEEGSASLIGHISKGNRPSQACQEGYMAFDWKISLRTLRRDPHCKIRLQMTHKQLPSCSQTSDYPEKHPLHADHCLHTESPL